jgi:hypothetical protein
VQPPIPVALIVGLVHLPDAGGQPLVLHSTLRPFAGGALIVGGRRHVQGLTDRLDAEALAVAGSWR